MMTVIMCYLVSLFVAIVCPISPLNWLIVRIMLTLWLVGVAPGCWVGYNPPGGEVWLTCCTFCMWNSVWTIWTHAEEHKAWIAMQNNANAGHWWHTTVTVVSNASQTERVSLLCWGPSASLPCIDIITCCPMRPSFNDRAAFPIAAARLRNTLPLNVTSASSISVFRKHLKTLLFSHFPQIFCSARAVTLSFLDTAVDLYYWLDVVVTCVEKRIDNSGRVYFVNHRNRTTQWEDPRTQG